MTAAARRIDHDVDPSMVFDEWLSAFGAALQDADAGRVAALFDADGTWRDVLSFTGDYRNFDGRPAVEAALRESLPTTWPARIRPADGRSEARWARRLSVTYVEGFFDFDTGAGTGTGFARLRYDAGQPAGSTVALLMTCLQTLDGHPAQVGEQRPSGLRWSYNFAGDNWKDERERARTVVGRTPQVLIIGAGQSGLALAARLRVHGVDALVVEANPRVGDNWRNRYHSLTLHNETWVNHLPYMPFPPNWPTYVPKDKIADWLEYYAEAMEIDVVTSTRLVGARRDEATGSWSVTLHTGEGEPVELSVPHIVWATGAVSGAPYVPRMPGLEAYKGEVIHSAQFLGGPHYAGRSAIVFGTGNSGHDVAQDLYSNGAASVTMVQRGPTTVVSLQPSSSLVYGAYLERPVEDVDLFVLATSYEFLRAAYQRMVPRTRQLDAELLKGLEAAGFRTDEGEDDTGWHMKYLRRGGGYYINVGASQLVADGSIGLLDAARIEGFGESGLVLRDGGQLDADLVVFATGFEGQSSTIEKVFGAQVSAKVGPIWGFDDEGYMRAMWRRTGQDGFWVMGGSLLEARVWSTFLTLQLLTAIDDVKN